MRRPTFLKVTLGVALVLFCLSALDANGFRRHFQLERDIQTLAEKNARLQEENQALIREIQALRTDPRAQERAAREELGYIRPGERVIDLEGP